MQQLRHHGEQSGVPGCQCDDQSISHMSPVSGGCWTRWIFSICSRVTSSSLNSPPCVTKTGRLAPGTCDEMRVASGRWLNTSVNSSKQGLSTFALTSPLESVDAVHVEALMVASGEVEVVGVQQLIGEEEDDDLHTEGASVYEVSVEQVWVGRGWRSVDGEEVQHVVELAVYISTHCDVGTLRARRRAPARAELGRGGGWRGGCDRRSLRCSFFCCWKCSGQLLAQTPPSPGHPHPTSAPHTTPPPPFSFRSTVSLAGFPFSDSMAFRKAAFLSSLSISAQLRLRIFVTRVDPHHLLEVATGILQLRQEQTTQLHDGSTPTIRQGGGESKREKEKGSVRYEGRCVDMRM